MILEERDRVKMKDSNNNIKDITINTTGNLLWGGVIVPDMNILNQSLGNYVQSAYLTSQLALKQDVLTVGTGITLSSNTIELDFLEERDRVKMKDSNNNVKEITINTTGQQAIYYGVVL